MRIFHGLNIDFMGMRKIWYTISVATLLIGIAAIFTKGLTYGIDFKGGTELVLRFQTAPAIEELRSAVDQAGFKGSEIKSYGNPTDILIFINQQSEKEKASETIKAEFAKRFPQNNFSVLRDDKIGPKVGAELRRNAFYAIFATLVIILVYIGFRFKFEYGMMAVVALFHDVIATLGIVVIFNGLNPHLNLEINLTMMAAFLTLIGFSTNDTIIVFDRIRENLRIYKSESLYQVMNRSINETLSRTVITSGTVFLVLIVLIVFGGEVNRGFAFTFMVGTLFGTYSSIYVASALVLDYNQRRGASR